MSDLEAQGVEADAVEVVGGGAFGVIDESNWTVCSQEPATGGTVGDRVRLVVDRSCDADETEKTEAAPDEKAETATGPAKIKPKPAKKVEKVDTFAMPDLVGMVLQDAQDVLQDEGSFLMQQVDATGAHRPKLLDSNWRVCAQSPAPGTRTPIDDVVRLESVKLDEVCP